MGITFLYDFMDDLFGYVAYESMILLWLIEPEVDVLVFDGDFCDWV